MRVPKAKPAPTEASHIWHDEDRDGMLRQMLESLPQMACLCRKDGLPQLANTAWTAFFGTRHCLWLEALHPEDRKTVELAVHAGPAAPGIEAECRLLDAAGRWDWFTFAIRPFAGDPDQGDMLVSAWPIGHRKRQAAALQGSFSLLERMLDASPDCIKVISPSGRLQHMNRAGCLALGLDGGRGFGMEWLPLLPAEVREAGAAALARAAAGETARFPGASLLPGQPQVYWDNLLTPLLDDAGKVTDIVCVSRDVTQERVQEQELRKARQDLARTGERLSAALEAETVLVGEMHHRIKNLFTMVTGLIAMSKRAAPISDEALRCLGDLKQRIFALARANDILMQSAGGLAAQAQFDPIPVTRAVLQPYEGHFGLEGRIGDLPAYLLTPLVLLVHEMATNSLKHGALRDGAGFVRLRWSESPEGSELVWTEEGGPAIAGFPAAEGFGSGMLQNVMRMAGGELHLDWRGDGLTATVRLLKG